MRYSSPETSLDDWCTRHYSLDAETDDWIPKIHVHDCPSYCHVDTTSLKSRLKRQEHCEPSLQDDLLHTNNILVSRAKSFDHYNTVDNFFTQQHDRIDDSEVLRRAKSVEYEAVSSNIFSDDSLRTARRKVKRNLSDNGDNIPTMSDHSKSYYDSTGDSSKNSESILDVDEAFHESRKFYSYDPETHLINRDNYIKTRVPSLGLMPHNCSEDDHVYRNYEAHYSNCNSPSRRRASANNNANAHEHYGLVDSDHTYCSIDENPIEAYKERHKSDIELDKYLRRKLSWSKRRTKSTDSYLEDDYPYNNYNKPEYFETDHLQDYTNDCRLRSSSYPGRTEPFPEVRIFRESRMKSLEVPSLSKSKRMMLEKAESSPILGPELDNDEDTWERTRRLSRRRRNSSCPEARDTRSLETLPIESDSRSFFMGSSEDFGSLETVVDADYVRDHRYSADYVDSKAPIKADRSGSYPGPSRQHDFDYLNRKTSCPECTSHQVYSHELRQLPKAPEIHDLPTERYQEHRPLVYHHEEMERQQRRIDHEQGNKRNVAISDTLEYYEYSMDSESQCSENCGFGPYDSLRPRNRAPHPGKANSNIFDSQTSDTAKNPRVNDDTTSRNVKQHNPDHDDATGTTALTQINPEFAVRKNNDEQRRSSDYNSPGGSYEKNTRHPVAGNGHNGHAKRGQFSRSLSNADVPPDEKAGKLIMLIY